MAESKHFHFSTWLTVCGALVFLAAFEMVRPAAFFWDDNANEFWPWYAFNYAAMSHGVLPQIDFYNYLGSPYLSSGQPGVFYPPIYLAVALAQALHRPEVAIDWLCWVHLAAAALVVERLARLGGSTPGQAMAAGWLYVTLPFVACSPQVWVYNAYTAFYVPLIFLQLELMMRQPTLGRLAVLALVKAVFFFSGAINYYVLSLIYELAYVAFRLCWKDAEARPSVRIDSYRPALVWVGANVLAVLWALPSFGPVMDHLSQSAERAHPMALGLALEETIHPLTFLGSQVGLFFNDRDSFYLYRPGWLFLGGSVVVPLLLASGWRDGQVRRWGLLALLALVLSTAAFAIIHFVPGYGSLRWPAKSFLFTGLFYVLAFAALLRNVPQRWSSMTGPVILLVAMVTNIGVAFGPWSRSGSESFPRYAPEFHLPLDQLREGRTALVGLTKGDFFNPDFLGFEFATLTRVPAFAGDDPLTPAQNRKEALDIVFVGLPWHELDDEMVKHMSEWSVRYYFAHELSPAVGYLEGHARFRPIYRRGPLLIFEDKQAAPLAYFEDDPQQALPMEFGDNKVTIDTHAQPYLGILSVSLVPLPGYSWREADGGRWLPVPAAPGGRMQIAGVPGGTSIEIRYEEPWERVFIGVALGSALVFFSLLVFLRGGVRGGRARP